MPPPEPAGSTHPASSPPDEHVLLWPAAVPIHDVRPATPGAAAGIEIFADLEAIGLEGWRSLWTLVAAYQRVILWAPSLALLESLRDGAPSLPTPEQVVAWVRTGRIQILAHESWLTGELRDAARRIGPAARHAYDQLAEIRRVDLRSGRIGISARVRKAPDARNLGWAIDRFWVSEIDLPRLHREALEMVPSYVQIAARFGDPRLAPIELLRTLRNRGEAFLFSGAQRAVEPADDRIALELVRGCTKPDPPPILQEAKTAPLVDSDTLTAAVLSTISEARCSLPSRQARLRRGPGRGKARVSGSGSGAALGAWIAGCDAWVERGSGSPLDHAAERLLCALFADLPGGTPAAVAAMSSVEKVAFVGSVGLGLVSQGKTGSPLSLAQLSIDAAGQALRLFSRIADGFGGKRWPHYLAQPAGDANRALRESVIRTVVQS